MGQRQVTDAELSRKVGEILECWIEGQPTKLRRVKGHYNSEGDRCRCPFCGVLGIPWCGMFHCEGNNQHKAVIQTGQCFEVVGAK